MPTECSVCRHPERREVDRLLVRRVPLRDIERQHGLSRSALSRHQQSHIPVAVASEQRVAEEAHEEELARAVGDELAWLQRETRRIYKEARQTGQLRNALAALREARYLLDLQIRREELAGMEERLAALEERAV